MRHMMILGVTALLLAVQADAEETRSLKTQKEKISYVIGVDQIRNFKRQGIDADLELVIRGMRDAASGGKLLIGEGEGQKILADYSIELKAKQAQLKKELAERNKKEGAAFLTENKKKEGVVTTVSGLQYKVLKGGKGKSPTDESAVTVKYRGTLLDGTEFDSSELLGYPMTFYVKDSVIAGWAEALKLMSAGARWQVFVPPQLGYGEKGAGRDIGPNAILIYDIELIAVNPEVVQKKMGTETVRADIASHKNCPHCGMDRGVHDTSRMLLTYQDGTSAGTCSIVCLTTEFKKNSAKKVASVQVADYNTKKLIDAQKAYWVLGGDKKGVMSKTALWAFAKHQEAEVFIRQHGGKLIRYKEALSLAEKNE